MARKSRYITAAVALLLCMCTLLCGCSKGNKFVMQNGMYVDKKTDISYHDAPACYEPLAIGTERYGMLGDVELFEIVGADPKQWLCEATGTVFYADGITLPAVDQLNTSYMALMYEETQIAKITDAALIEKVAKEYVNGENIAKPSWNSDMYDVNWRVRFVDESIGIFYVIAYFELAEDYVVTGTDGVEINYGKRFLYNRFEDKMVVVSDALAPYVAEYKEQGGAN
ncbi:MAG: hypothetical protein E7653_07790 [Ruminococcaceae bacterium]|nr:hypothetical protein [Oscillospiraceae bacterium]